MGRGPSVTKEEYGFIKQLLAKGKTTEEIRRQVNRSPDTVRCVNYSIDYDDFVNTPTKTLRQRCKKQPEQQKMDIPDLEKDKTLPPPPNFVDVPAFFIDRTDNVICHQIAQVAINAINALLDIHKRRCDHGDSSSDPGVQRVG